MLYGLASYVQNDELKRSFGFYAEIKEVNPTSFNKKKNLTSCFVLYYFSICVETNLASHWYLSCHEEFSFKIHDIQINYISWLTRGLLAYRLQNRE